MPSDAVLEELQKQFGSAIWSKWSVQRWMWYDYIRYDPAGPTTLNFFANPLGAQDPVSGNSKTYEQTNTQKARSFGQTYFMAAQIRTVFRILPDSRQPSAIQASSDADVHYAAWSDVMDELYQLAGIGSLRWDILQKDYFQIEQPFQFAPPGFGVDIRQHASSNDGSPAYWMQLSPYVRDVYALTPPQLIEPEQTFSAQIEFPETSAPSISGTVNGADPAIDIGWIFDGYILRPVQ